VTTETHEFCQTNGTPSVYFHIPDALQLAVKMTKEGIRKLVHDRIHCRNQLKKDSLLKNTNENNKIIEKNCDQDKKVVNENEFEVSAAITKIILCMTFVKTIDETKSSVRVRYYGENQTQCIYMIYDETQKHFYLLYLYNKMNPNEEKRTTFTPGDSMIKILLRKYFKEHLNC